MTDLTGLFNLPTYLIGDEWNDSHDPSSPKRTLEEVENEEENGWRKKTRKLGDMSNALAKKRESLKYNPLCLIFLILC
jgi:hypothetical protein